MATAAVAAATLPIPLELRLPLSRLHVCFKIRGSDEAVSARADSVYHFEVSEMPILQFEGGADEGRGSPSSSTASFERSGLSTGMSS